MCSKQFNDALRLTSLQMPKKIPKSCAEIQKACRKRIKEKKGAAYIEKKRRLDQLEGV